MVSLSSGTKIFILKRARGLIAGKGHIRQVQKRQLPGMGISGRYYNPAVFQTARPQKYQYVGFLVQPLIFL
jgi:hypothetical protein